MSEKKKILLTYFPISPERLELLKETARACGADCEFVYRREGVTEEDVRDISACIGNLSPALCPKAVNMKWLQLNSAGADAYTAPGILPEGCVLTNATGAYSVTVSEHMLALTFALVRRLNQYARVQARRGWDDCGNIISVEGATVLVLGLGDIGSAYARKVRALGAAKVIGIRRHIDHKPDYLDEIHTMDDLDALLPQCDIVAMVLPGGAQTDHLMDEKRLRLMKKTAYLINAGRGNAIDPAALKKALKEGWIAGAAVDVTEPEPLPQDDELWTLGNLIITPHVAGWFFLDETVRRIIEIARGNLCAWLKGETLKNCVNLKKGY